MALLPTIINWYGGKQKLARQIISIMPEHHHYVETFFGSGAIFFNKPKVPVNTINDINSDLVNLFVQVRDNFDKLAEKVYWTLYSHKEYRKFYKIHQNNYKGIDDVTRAMVYLFLIKTSFSGQIDTNFACSVDISTATFNLNLIERMRTAREKLDNVTIENLSYRKFMPKYLKSNEVLMYLDPPYWVSNKSPTYYEHLFIQSDHRYLRDMLVDAKCKWILSYDEVPEIIKLYKDFNIMRISAKYPTGRRNQSIKVNELLITNFRSKLPQLDIFDEGDIETSQMEISEISQISEMVFQPKEEIIFEHPKSSNQQKLFD